MWRGVRGGEATGCIHNKVECKRERIDKSQSHSIIQYDSRRANVNNDIKNVWQTEYEAC